MTGPWAKSWRDAGVRRYQGGQGRAFIAEKTDGSGERAFVKILRRPRNPAARKRFYREATTYETLDAAGIPRLLEHNAEDWAEDSVDLYIALEYIDGVNLGDLLRTHGPLALDTAVDMTIKLARTLGSAHAQGVLHRDIKPTNVVLRRSEPASPVVVDFGLSFNETDELDVTRVNEEVGNRFLRLPEHSLSFRSPASDLSQLTGVMLTSLTGIEPRVLLDSDALPPHQRAATAEALASTTGMSKSAQLKLLSIFDRAFAVRIDARYQDAEALIRDLEAVGDTPLPAGELEALRERLRAAATDPAQLEAAGGRETIQALLLHVGHVYKRVANESRLQQSQSGQRIWVDAGRAMGRTRLALFPASAERGEGREYRFEIAGPAQATLHIDDELAWRGPPDGDTELDSTVEKAALERYFEDFPQ